MLYRLSAIKTRRTRAINCTGLELMSDLARPFAITPTVPSLWPTTYLAGEQLLT